jgi:hypothetical protein
MRETWQGLFTYFVANFLSFSMPTHTYDFGNHNDGYDHSKTALVRSLADRRKLVSSMV